MGAAELTSGSPATDAAAALLDELFTAGLEHIVVCPGSRSQALALAASDMHRRGRVQMHVRLDERAAGFFALGLARATGRPAAVVVTSGTAVANLAPAVLEAHHSGVPLLLLTADRPPELRGVGANQATTQPGMFANFVRWEVDAPTPTQLDTGGDDVHPHRAIARHAWESATAVPAGPVHVNLPLREPLAGALPSWWSGERVAAPSPRADDMAPSDDVAWHDGARTIVIAGADSGAAAVAAAERFGWPLVAEIVSGSRFGDHVVPRYREALRDEALGGAVQRVVVFGHPTLTREVTAVLRRDDVDVVAVRGPGERLNLNGRTRSVSDIAAVPGDAGWLRAWTTDREREPQAVSGFGREFLVSAVWEATTERDTLVWGSSRLVRVADAVLAPRQAEVFANRGLAGIDGTIATAYGVAVGSGAERTRVVLGDLTFLHDVGALLIPADEPGPRIQLVVGNDGGGTIFDTLEVAQTASAADFARVQYTPQAVRIAALADAYGWHYISATTPALLRDALMSAHDRVIIEVPLER